MKDVSFFDRVVAAAERAQPARRGLIVELLDKCNMECPTCIAGSGLLAGNVRRASILKRRISAQVLREPVSAILLSGGEPTIHPEFFDLVEFVSGLETPARVVITNGERFASDPSFAERFVEVGSNRLEVFLQWDSLRPEALLDIRGHDYSALRLGALENLNRANVTTTLVNVIKRGVTLECIDEVLATARDWDNVVGVQFQPIRDAGRVLDFTWEANSCDVVDVFDQLPGGVRLTPSTAAPWSTFLGWMHRPTGQITPAPDDDAFFVSPTNSTPTDRIRIAVLDYSDRFNWTTERSRLAALDVLDDTGGTSSVDDYFLDLANTDTPMGMLTP
jgi:organic radical activating enzyme